MKENHFLIILLIIVVIIFTLMNLSWMNSYQELKEGHIQVVRDRNFYECEYYKHNLNLDVICVRVVSIEDEELIPLRHE